MFLSNSHTIIIHISSCRYVNAASGNIYICLLSYNTFRSATFYKDTTLVIHAVAKELGPQKVNLWHLTKLYEEKENGSVSHWPI